MNITSDQLDQIVGVGVCVALFGGALVSLARNNPGVDGQEWLSDGLTWRRRGNPPQEQRHPAAKAE